MIPLIKQALIMGVLGALAAAATDAQAFRSWKKWSDVARFDWGVATWRWFQGFVIGAVGSGAASQILSLITR